MTSTSNNDHYFGAILEDIQSKQDFLVEVVSGLAHLPEDVKQLKEDMTDVKRDIRVIKNVLTDHNHRIDDHKVRIGKLEASS